MGENWLNQHSWSWLSMLSVAGVGRRNLMIQLISLSGDVEKVEDIVGGSGAASSSMGHLESVPALVASQICRLDQPLARH